MQASQPTIRRVDPATEMDGIRAVLQANLPDAAARERLEWLYLSNPDGPSLVWLLEDAGGEPVGTSAAHPRRMRLRGEVVRALNLSDFAIDAACRSLGPALRLLRATLAAVSEGEYAFSIDYPSASMQALYRRMGTAELLPTERRVRPTRLSGIARRRLGDGLVGTVAGAAGDAAVRARDSLLRVPRGLEIEELQGPCGEEFDELEERLAQLRPVVGVRDAAYLNWRYLGHATWRHTILCAREGGNLLGFAALRSTGGAYASLVDLFAIDDARVRRGLVAGALRWVRSQEAQGLESQVLAGSAQAAALDALGFVARERGPGPVPFVEGPGAEALRDAASWWLTEGDRDI